MGIFQQEMNLSGVYDAQINMLSSIDRSFQQELSILENMHRSVSNIEVSLNHIARELVTDMGEFNESVRRSDRNLSIFYAHLSNSNQQLSEFNQNLDGASGEADKSSKTMKRLGEAAWSLFTKFTKFDRWFDDADDLSKSSNLLIKYSGMNGEAVKEFRNDLTDVVKELNKTTGYYYDLNESYRDVIAWTRNVTSDLEAISELSEPLLLANEALDVNIANIADLFNKFYIKYGFNSDDMNEVLTSIKDNTTDNVVSQERLEQSMARFQDDLAIAAGGNTDLLTELLKYNNEGIAYASSLGLSNESLDYIEQMKSTLYNENYTDLAEIRPLLQVLNEMGYSLEDMRNMFSSTDENYNAATATEILVQALAQLGGTIESSSLSQPTAQERGFDWDVLKNIYAASIGEGWVGLEDFRANQAASTSTLEENVEDKYVNMSDKIYNWLDSTLIEKLSDIQETLGIGVGEIAFIFTTIAGALLGGGSLASIGSKIFGGGGRAASSLASTTAGAGGGSAGLAGGAAGGGAGLGIAGAAGIGLGVGLGIDGIAGMTDDTKSDTYRALSGLELGLGTAGALGVAGGAAGLTVAGVSAGPIGWALLAAGGLTLLGKKAYENAYGLSDGAERVRSELEEAGKALEDENQDRITALQDLRYEFNQLSDNEAKKNALLESGLISEEAIHAAYEELQAGNADALNELLNSYLYAAQTMTDISNKLAEEYYTENFSESQKEFSKILKGSYSDLSEQERLDILNEILMGSNDEKLNKNIRKYIEDDDGITEGEWNKIFGKSWFGTSVDNADINEQTMKNIVSAYGGVFGDYEVFDTSNSARVQELINQYATLPYKSPERKAIYDTLVNEGLLEEFLEITGMTKSDVMNGYRDGTNYIEYDQVAYLHEGEAVTPKKYNPYANLNELEVLRERVRENNNSLNVNEDRDREIRSIEDVTQAIQEVADFLKYWRKDSIRRESIKEKREKLASSLRSAVSSYMSNTDVY